MNPPLVCDDSVTIGSNLTGPDLQSLDINSHGESLNVDWIFNSNTVVQIQSLYNPLLAGANAFYHPLPYDSSIHLY